MQVKMPLAKSCPALSCLVVDRRTCQCAWGRNQAKDVRDEGNQADSLDADMTSRLGDELFAYGEKFADRCVPPHVLSHCLDHANVSAVSFMMLCVHSPSSSSSANL